MGRSEEDNDYEKNLKTEAFGYSDISPLFSIQLESLLPGSAKTELYNGNWMVVQ